MGARIESAEHLEDFVFESHAEAFKPGDGAVGVLAEHFDAFFVRAEVTRRERLLRVQFPAVLNPLLGLAHGVGGVHLALCELRVAAREEKAFEHRHLGTRIRCLDGGRKARAARTDDDDVVLFIPLGGEHRRRRLSFGLLGKPDHREARSGPLQQMTTIEVHVVLLWVG